MTDITAGGLKYTFKADGLDALKRGMDEAKSSMSRMKDEAQSASTLMKRGFEDVTANLRNVSIESQAVASAIKLAFGAVAATIAATLLLALPKAREQFQELTDLVGKVDKSGVSGTLFQSWTQQATALKLSVGEAEQAIISAGKTLEKQLNPLNGNQGALAKRADFLANAGGSTAAKDAIETARTLDQMHQAALLLVRDYQLAADEARRQGLELTAIQRNLDAARVATEVWGEAGQKVADGIRDGSLNVDDYIAKSRAARGIWSNEILDAHKRVNEELAAAHQKLSNELQPVFEAIEKLSIAIASAWAKVIDGIAQAVQAARQLAKELDVAIAKSGVTQGGLLHKEGEAASSVFERMRGSSTMGRLIPLGDWQARPDVPAPPFRPDDLGARRVGGGTGAHHARGGGSGAAAHEATDQVKSYIDHLKQAQSILQAEVDTWGKGNVEREKAVALARADEIAKRQGKTLTDQQRAAIEATAEATAQLRDRLDELREKQTELNDAMRQFGDFAASALQDIVTRARSAKEVLADLARTLSSSLIRGALTGEGAFGRLLGLSGSDGNVGGLFGKLLGGFSGFFAEGGSIPRGQWGIAGERGPEVIVGPAAVIPQNALASAPASDAPSGHTINNHFHFPPGTDAISFRRSEAQISAMLARAVAGASARST